VWRTNMYNDYNFVTLNVFLSMKAAYVSRVVKYWLLNWGQGRLARMGQSERTSPQSNEYIKGL